MSKKKNIHYQSPKVLKVLYTLTFFLALLVKIIVIRYHVIWPIVALYGIVLPNLERGKKSARVVFFLLSFISIVGLVFCCMGLYLIVTDEYFARLYSSYSLAYIGYVLLGICHIVTCIIMIKSKQ